MSFIITFMFMFTYISIIPVKASGNNEELLKKVNTSINNVHKFIVKNGTWSSDWKTVAFNKSGLQLPENYNGKYLEDTKKLLKNSKGYFYKVTDYERITLGVVAAGGDPRNVGGYNLLDKIYNFHDPKNPNRKIDFQGLNGVIYALIALDTKNYEIPAGAKFTREYMLDYVLENRNTDGGWDLNMSGNKSDVDITSMTLIALAPHHDYVSKDGKKVTDAIKGAIDWLSKVQRQDGGFNSWFTENNSESCAQTIIGLCANGIDPTSAKFTKNRNLVENLLRFQQSNGEFYHLMDGSEGVNGMSTEQAYQAILAYRDFAKEKGSIYWFDNKKVPTTFKDLNGESNNKSEDLKDVENNKVQRIKGKDRFETSVKIGNKFRLENGEEKLKNVIVSSAFGFADSLSGSILSKKLDAPIMLTGNNESSSKEAIEYIKNNVDKKGNVYILGGIASVNSTIENTIKNNGYNIKRLSGEDRYGTCNSIVKEFGVKEGTPVVIVNGLNFADALSVSAPASIKGYPVLLSGNGALPEYAKSIIKTAKPSEVFIIGGEGALSKNIEDEVKKIYSSLKITRLSGKDRYETSLKVNKYFDNNETVIMASGINYPDALSGSALAGKLNASLLLINDGSLNNQIKFINKEKTKEVILLGGEGVLSKKVENSIKKSF
ncbi:hypothetical protein OPLHCY645_11880 [Clostridium tetani]